MNIDQPLTLTVEQAAKLLGIGRSTAYELVHTGDIPSLRLGRRIVVPVGKIAERLGVAPTEVSGALRDAEPITTGAIFDTPDLPSAAPDGSEELEPAATLF